MPPRSTDKPFPNLGEINHDLARSVLQMVKDNDVKFVDYRLTDTRGKEQHMTVPAHQLTEDTFEDGQAFDGSSMAGWKGIEASDMILMPDPETAAWIRSVNRTLSF